MKWIEYVEKTELYKEKVLADRLLNKLESKIEAGFTYRNLYYSILIAGKVKSHRETHRWAALSVIMES